MRPASNAVVFTLTVSVDGGAAQDATLGTLAPDTWTWPFTLTLTLPNGTHTVVLQALDYFGALLTTATYTVTNNGTPPPAPTVSITAPTPGQTINGSSGAFTVTGTAAATSPATITAVKVRLGGRAWVTASGTTTWSQGVTLPSGYPTTIEAQSFTASGASAIASVTATYVPPLTVAITSPDNGSTVVAFAPIMIVVTGTATAAVGAPAVTSVQVSVNGWESHLASGTTWWVTNVTLNAGYNTIIATAFAGSVASAPVTIRVTVLTPAVKAPAARHVRPLSP